jgi:hypothetical protein
MEEQDTLLNKIKKSTTLNQLLYNIQLENDEMLKIKTKSKGIKK